MRISGHMCGGSINAQAFQIQAILVIHVVNSVVQSKYLLCWNCFPGHFKLYTTLFIAERILTYFPSETKDANTSALSFNPLRFHLFRIVKMSSPKLNNVIIVGCILCYISVILFGLDARFLGMRGYGINCNVRESLKIVKAILDAILYFI